MTKSKTTKKALLSSVLALVLCFTMLLGTTFAWFTDTASTSVNTIQAGTLDIELLDENGTSLEGQTLSWQKAEGHENEAVLWEPGCTYKLQPITIKNSGNLALKYKVVIAGIDGSAKLNEVIDWTIKLGENTYSADDEMHLAATESATMTISGHMQESAGNAYQGEKIEGVAITVYATQDTVEYDSTTNEYDKNATYAEPVSSETELLEAFENGGSVVLTDNINVSTGVDKVENGKQDSKGRKATYIEKNLDIDLNGKTLNLSGNNILMATDGVKVTISNGKITGNCNNLVWASNGSDLTLTNCEIDASTSGHAVSARRADGDTGAYSKLTLNNCKITAKESCVGAMNGGIVVINGGEYTSIDNYVVGTNGTDSYSGNEITINGGTFTGTITSTGYIACGVYMAHEGDKITINAGTFNITNGVGLCARYGEATVAAGVVWNVTGDSTTTGKVGAQGAYHAGYTYDGVDGTVNGEKNYH